MNGNFTSALNFYHIVFEKNSNRQHERFTKTFSISRSNLLFPRTNCISCFSLVFNPIIFEKYALLSCYSAMQFAIFLVTRLQNVIRPSDTHVGGLMFYHGFFLSSFFFRRLISELAERNSTKIGHMLGSNRDLKTRAQSLGYLQIGGPKTTFSDDFAT